MLVCKGTRQLQVGNGGNAGVVVAGHQGPLQYERERRAPHDRGRKRAKPNAAHPALTRITDAMRDGGTNGHKLAETSGPSAEVVHNAAKISEAVDDELVETNAVAITRSRRILQSGEQSTGARQGGGHETEVAQQLMPLEEWHATPR